jgi:uncharacterized protein YdbL (DUF1318 family)
MEKPTTLGSHGFFFLGLLKLVQQDRAARLHAEREAKKAREQQLEQTTQRQQASDEEVRKASGQGKVGHSKRATTPKGPFYYRASREK